MALNLDEAMKMSLDDYIANMNKTSSLSVSSNNLSKLSHDGKFGRRKNNIESEEDDEDDDVLLKEDELLNEDELLDEDELMNEDEDINKNEKFPSTNQINTGIWKAPSSSISYLDCNHKQNDLREKLNNNNISNNNNRQQSFSAVQCRLNAPNNLANRPRGIPTLLPLDAYISRKPDRWNNGKRNKKHNNFNNANRNNDNGRNNNLNNSHYRNNSFKINNGRIQRNGNKNLQFNRNMNNETTVVPPNRPRNLIIECPNECVNIQPSSKLTPNYHVPKSFTTKCAANGNNVQPIGNLTPQAQAVLNLNSNGMAGPSNSSSVTNNDQNLRSLLGLQGSISGEMMPVFASRLLEFIQSGGQAQIHKPVYDMQVQKDIHQLQNKPLLYKCNGGREVVSCDGEGVDNCKITPRTSGVSLNCRFA